MLEVVREPDAETDAEPRALLVGLARGAFGAIAPTQIADHVLALTAGAEWPVRRAALLALARRFRFAARDELRVCVRPAGGAVLGEYRTESAAQAYGKRARGQALRPYRTELSSLSPLVMSCSCADFVRSSLGLCKHGLTVLRELAERKGRPQVTSVLERDRPHLRWDPAHPLTGSADRLARLHCEAHGRARAKAGAALVSEADRRKALRSPETRRDFVAKLEQLLSRGTLTAEPAVTTLLREEGERVERQLAVKARKKDALKQLKSLKRTLYPYQRDGVARFLERGRLLLADDMGLGKTTQAVAAAHALFASRAVRRGVVIVPNSLKLQWKREWEATTDAPIVLVEGQPGERKRLYRSTDQGFLLMAYEQLVRDLEEVQRFAPELVVLDEAQRIKNWATKSATYVKALVPRYRLVLTGTPMENRLEELASIMDFVDDLALEPKWRLVPLHMLHDERAQRGPGGAKNLSILRERLSDSMLRRVRSEVLAQLPPRTDTRVPIELTEVQREAHDELRRPIAELAATAAKRPLRPPEFLRLMQLLMRQRMISNGMAQVEFDEHWKRIASLAPTPALLEGLFAPKLSAFRALTEQVVLGQGRKAVVFSQWRNMLKLAAWSVRDLLSNAGMRALFFTGAESTREREAAVLAFHEDPQATLLFLSDAGGVGLNLQRAASVCVNLELPWNPAVLEQRIGRVYRLGQPAPVDIYNLVSESGIETRIAELVAQKSALFRSLFDGTSDEIRFEGQSSFAAKVQQLVELPTPVIPTGAGVEPDEDEGELASAPAPFDGAQEEAERAAPVVASEPCVRSAPPAAGALPGLTVTRGADGSIRIEAPAALAQPLADLLDSLAHALRSGSGAASETQG